ncbi:hypothetical protein IQ13_2871 [Lacibacter cauensis]|uniref:Uncharacterized protein n=1 Tax=Lacibacter cauensis TaxID=510947 RepID=A0A562SHF2_9BACT|nr:hypothetical protein IQ13_2871 [Lacibacter cauensis]
MRNMKVEDSGFVLELKKSSTAVRLSADCSTTGISVHRTVHKYFSDRFGIYFLDLSKF